MEFSYTISEEDYLSAVQLATRSYLRTGMVLTVFALISIVDLIQIFGFLIRAGVFGDSPSAVNPVPLTTGSVVAQLIVPILIISVLEFLLFLWPKLRRRRLYRKDPSFRGQFIAEISRESFRRSSTVGASVHVEWKLLKSWREAKNLIILMNHAKCLTILNVSGLTEMERVELRKTLAEVLPENR